jgi:hypothetical protein
VSRRIGAAKLIMATMAATTAQRSAVAADWSQTLDATANAAYVTNPDSVPGSSMADHLTQLIADGNTAMQTELGQLTITPHVSMLRYARDTNLDIDTGSIAVSYVEKLERGQWNVSGQASTDSTLTSELGTTGIADVNFRHYQDNASLGYQYLSSERLAWLVQGSWLSARYNADAERYGLTSYDYGSAQLGPDWSFSERLDGSLILGADRINAQFAPTEKDYSASLELKRSLSERYAWRASLGASRVEAGTGAVGSSSLFELGATWQGERVQWDVSAKRAVQPIGFALLAREDSATLSIVVGTSLHSTLNFSANVIRSYPVTAIFNVAPGVSFGLPIYSGAAWGQASAEWRYQLSPNWTLSALYSQGRARNDNIPQWADTNQVRLGIVWQSDRL